MTLPLTATPSATAVPTSDMTSIEHPITVSPEPRRSRRALAAQGAVLALLIGGATAWVATDKDVTLVVDGETQALSTHVDDVEGLLDEAGLEVGEHDLLAPGPDSPIQDGSQVVLRRAREISLDVDGETRKVWVTAAGVNEALDQLGIADDRAFVSADRSGRIPLEGMALQVRLPKPVTVVGGAAAPVALDTTAADVAGVLAQARVGVDGDDRVSVPLDSAPTAGQQIVVTHVEHGTRSEVVPVAPREVRQDDSSLPKGQTTVVAAGRSGEAAREVAFVKENGVEVSSTVLEETVTRQAEDRVVRVGTQQVAAAGPSGAWAKVAQCESGGNPRAVSSTGKYHGLYQFSVATWQSVGGSGLPSQASSGEQTLRAQMLYERAGRGQWPHCGKYLP